MEHNLFYSVDLIEYCVQHGHVMHFLGTAIEDDYMCEAIFCSGCYPDHPENPIVQNQNFDECGNICHY